MKNIKMKSIKKVAAMSALLLFILVGATGCNRGNDPDAHLEITFGNQTYPEVIIAYVNGFFAEELAPYNASVNIATFTSGPPMIEALAARSLDFAAFGPQPGVQAIASGVPVRIISGITDGTDNIGLVARTDSGITEVRDIRGKTIAAPAGTTGHMLLLAMLNHYGMTIDDVEFVNLAIGTITQSLIAGHVDGAVAFGETVFAPPVEEGVVQISTGVGYKRNINVISARTEFLENHSDEAVAVLRALQRAAEWRVENPDETADIVAEFLGTDRAVVERSFGVNITLLGLDEGARAALLTTAELLYHEEIISTRLTEDDLFDLQFGQRAGLVTLPGHGAYRIEGN